MTVTADRSRRPDERTGLALERTRLAHDRTLMAWVRTATSLISFGFTIYKFFQYLREGQKDVPARLLGPREFAIGMIGLGVAALILATIEYRAQMKKLERDYSEYGPTPPSPSTAVAAAVGIFGVIVMMLVLFHQ